MYPIFILVHNFVDLVLFASHVLLLIYHPLIFEMINVASISLNKDTGTSSKKRKQVIFHLTRNTIPKTLRILPYRARPIREMVTVTFFKDVRNDYLWSPSSSSMSYIHSPIYEDEIDVDWGKYAGDITESKMKWIRKKAGKLACVGMSSILR